MRGMAGSRTYRTCAIVLDKTKLKETDLILTLLARDGREIRAVAKGARKPGSRLAARCELFCTVDLLLAKGRSLDVVSQADLVGAPLGAAPTYEAMQRASVIAEVASLCCFEDATDPFVFSISAKALYRVMVRIWTVGSPRTFSSFGATVVIARIYRPAVPAGIRRWRFSPPPLEAFYVPRARPASRGPRRWMRRPLTG